MAKPKNKKNKAKRKTVKKTKPANPPSRKAKARQGRRKVLVKKSKIKYQKSKSKAKLKLKPKKTKVKAKKIKPKISKKNKKSALKKKPAVKKVKAKGANQARKLAVAKPKSAAKIEKHKKIAVPKKSPEKTEIKTEAKEQAQFSAQAFFKARIKVVGVGGGGGSIVSEIGRSLGKATFVVADTDIRALKKSSGIKYFWFGEELTRGLGTGVNVDVAKQAAEEAKEKISDNFKNQDIIIFIASLGGGLGSGATQVFAEEAKKYGAITFGIFTMPFKFEGKNKARIAQNALKSLRQSLNVSLTIPNEKIFKIIDESTPITTAFSVVNKSLIYSLESLIDLIYSPGIINIDFADLRTILKGRGNLAFLNTIEESGKNRADKICERVFVNPLLQNSSFDAEKILFNITGSENLSMFEVEKISSHIAKLSPRAKIIFGISKSSKLKNKIKTTILMTGGGIDREMLKSEVSTREEPVKPKKNIKLPRPKKQGPQKPSQKLQDEKPGVKEEKKQQPVPFAPPFEAPVASGAIDAKKMKVVETEISSAKKAIRRSGLEIKKAEEQEEKKRIAQEKEWEIPAFLRKVKFNK